METNLKTFLDSLRVGSVVFWLYNFGSLETKTKRIENYNQSNVRINRPFSFSDGRWTACVGCDLEKSRPGNQEIRESLTINFECQSMCVVNQAFPEYFSWISFKWKSFALKGIHLLDPLEPKMFNGHFWAVMIHSFLVIHDTEIQSWYEGLKFNSSRRCSECMWEQDQNRTRSSKGNFTLRNPLSKSLGRF